MSLKAEIVLIVVIKIIIILGIKAMFFPAPTSGVTPDWLPTSGVEAVSTQY